MCSMNYVLDIDDTLYLERNYVQSGFDEVGTWIAKNIGILDFSEKAWNLFINGQRGNIFNEALREYGLFDTTLIQELVYIYRNHRPDIKLEIDAYDFLSSKDIKNLFIITDGYAHSQRKKIDALGLKQYCSKIIVTDELGKDYWKPNIKAFEIIQNGISPKDFVYIADNPLKDFIAPSELGWQPSIRIRRKGSLYFEMETPSDCNEIVSFSEVI